jgi:hypothetical protein
MSTPAKYREYAAECLRATQRSSTPEARAELVQLAQRWTDLAGRAEHRAEQAIPVQIPGINAERDRVTDKASHA